MGSNWKLLMLLMLHNTVKKTLIGVLMLSCVLSVQAAKITYTFTDTGFSSTPKGLPDGRYAINLTGPIEQDDLKAFRSAINKLSQQVRTEDGSPLDRMLVLNSAGGDVATALSIGRIIRANQMHVVVPDSSKCLSSCVFLFSAGVVKWPWGDVGIHRPYFEAKPTQGYDQALKEVLNQSRVYFREMNIPEQLADDMFSIPPVEMRLLGDALLSKYRLDQDDMAYAEDQAIKNAKAYGLTRQEYERRQKLSEIYSKECRSTHKRESTQNPTNKEINRMVIECGDLGRQRAGLVMK